MRIVLEYDTTTGVLTDSTEIIIATWFGINSFDNEVGANVVDSAKLNRLNEQFTLDDIIKLKEAGLV